MDHIEKIVLDVLENNIIPERIMAKMIAKKIEEYGITLHENQIDELEKSIDFESIDTFSLDLDDAQEEQLWNKIKTSDDITVTIDIEEKDIEEWEEFITELTNMLISEMTDYFSDKLVKSWKAQANRVLNEDRKSLAPFHKKLMKIWGNSLDSLEMLIGISITIGEEFNRENYTEASKKNDLVFDILRRLHARACQVGYEILALLKGGFADGAMARWRTLHEIAVIALFITKHKDKVAQRYLDHIAIQNYEEAKAYQKHYEYLGLDPIPDDEFNEIEMERDRLCKLYGKGYGTNYGWARNVLVNVPTPNLTHLEKDIYVSHLRPYVKFSNINIHAGAKGITHRLGLPPEDPFTIVYGPSIFGLADPGQNSATSILQVTQALLLSNLNLDGNAVLSALQLLEEEVINNFSNAYISLEEKKTFPKS
jgi:hypothetical protein